MPDPVGQRTAGESHFSPSPALWLWELEFVSLQPSAHTGSLTAPCWLLQTGQWRQGKCHRGKVTLRCLKLHLLVDGHRRPQVMPVL